MNPNLYHILLARDLVVGDVPLLFGRMSIVTHIYSTPQSIIAHTVSGDVPLRPDDGVVVAIAPRCKYVDEPSRRLAKDVRDRGLILIDGRWMRVFKYGTADGMVTLHIGRPDFRRPTEVVVVYPNRNIFYRKMVKKWTSKK